MDKYNYNKTNWVGGKTVGTADIMNNLEEGVYQAHEQLENVNLQLEQIAKNQVSILEFGADTNNDDNKFAWDKAMDYLSSNGGGTLLIPDGIFNFSPNIKIKSNCSVKGVGHSTVLRVKDNCGDFYNFIGMDREIRNSISDCTIDLNRENNNGIIERLDGSFNPQIAVYFVNSHYSRVERCYMKACGVWAISTEASELEPYCSNLTFRDNIIEWYPQETEKTPVSNNMLYDNTMMYIDAENYIIENNTITCLLKNNGMTAIELHQRLGKAINNKLFGFRNGFLIVPMISAYNDKSCDMLVTNNTIEALCMGVSLWGVTTKKLDYVTISNNDIKMNSVGKTASYGICVNPSLPTDNNKEIENININNNTITFGTDTTNHNYSDYLNCFCGIWLRNVNRMKDIIIRGNTILNAPGNGLFVGSGKEGVEFYNINISENTIINCCSNTNISLSGYTKRASIYIGNNVKNSYIGTNTLINDKYDIDLIIADSSNLIKARQNMLIKNKISDFIITEFTPLFGFDNGSATFSNIKANYYLDGEVCTINIEVNITNPSSTGYSLYFRLPFKAQKSNELLDVAFSKCNVNKLNGFTLENSDLCYIRQSDTDMNALGPNQITSGAKLVISGSYLIKGRYE